MPYGRLLILAALIGGASVVKGSIAPITLTTTDVYKADDNLLVTVPGYGLPLFQRSTLCRLLTTPMQRNPKADFGCRCGFTEMASPLTSTSLKWVVGQQQTTLLLGTLGRTYDSCTAEVAVVRARVPVALMANVWYLLRLCLQKR